MEIDSNSGWHKLNCIRISNGESYRHAKMKFEISWAMFTQNYSRLPIKYKNILPRFELPIEIITETKMMNGREVDIVVRKKGKIVAMIEIETSHKKKKPEKGIITIVV